MNTTKIPLSQIKVASPCKASWESMSGDDHARFCDACSQHVYNLSELTQQEAEALIMDHEGKMCVRYYQRVDGTILTKDCPVGWRGLKRRVAIFGSVMAAALIALLGFATFGVLSGKANHAGGPGARFPNPIELIHDLLFPQAVAGGICPPPAPAVKLPAPGDQPPMPQDEGN